MNIEAINLKTWWSFSIYIYKPKIFTTL